MSKSCNHLQALFVAVGVTAAVPAFAQTSVEVNGLIDNFVGSMKNSGDAARTTELGQSGMTTSWWGVKGSEDLGNGMKANFAVDGFFQSNNGAIGRFTGDPMFSRDSWVGLSGGFGSVALGRNLAPNFLPTVIFNPFGDSFAFSPLVLQSFVPTASWVNSITGDTGWNNEVVYTSPDMAGLTVNVHYQLGGQAGQSGTNNEGLNAIYFHGPLALSAYYERIQVNNPLDTPLASGANIVQSITGPTGLVENATRQTAYFVGGSYDFSVVKLYATYQETSHDVDLKDQTYSLGAGVPVGTSGTINFDWAHTKRNASAIGLFTKRDTEALGYDYHLSKRTDLYADFMYDKIENLNTGTSVGFGIRHAF